MNTAVLKRSVVLNGRKTSVSLENEFWDALHEIANSRKISMPTLLDEIEHSRNTINFSSAIRIFVFSKLRKDAVSAQHHRPDGQNLRARAEECRVLAETFGHPETRATMLSIADDYERMAAQIGRSTTNKQ